MANSFDDVFAALGKEIAVEFLEPSAVEAIHDDLVEKFGGTRGVRSQELLEAALSRPLSYAAYNRSASIPVLAGILGAGVIQNHPFIDGNKRTGFALTITFLEKNGYTLSAGKTEALGAIKDCAAGTMDAEAFGRWVDRYAQPRHGVVVERAETKKAGEPTPSPK